jgi:hypothetical protein
MRSLVYVLLGPRYDSASKAYNHGLQCTWLTVEWAKEGRKMRFNPKARLDTSRTSDSGGGGGAGGMGGPMRLPIPGGTAGGGGIGLVIVILFFVISQCTGGGGQVAQSGTPMDASRVAADETRHLCKLHHR